MFNGFRDRHDAGILLSKSLARFKAQSDTVVLALPRGGVPVAYEVARALKLPLDIVVVRKLGVPGHEEFAFGAVASGGVRFLNGGIVNSLRMTDAMVERVIEREELELGRREKLYRGDRPALNLHGKIVIVVDDGLATGASMRVAIESIKALEPKQIIVAAPVASRNTCEELKDEADVLCICAVMPEPFYAVGLWYEDFSQTTDEEVRELLTKAEMETQKAAQFA